MTGRLVVVATPIGNLGDLSPRAAEALRTAHLVLAEDTRRTARLLQHVGADVPMAQHHRHNEAGSTAEVLPRLVGGETVVLVSDAGTPVVSDPGSRLVAEASAAGVTVEAVPGPSAVLHALVVSGVPTERFAFEGFLPRKQSEREERLAEVAVDPRTTIWFVPPHRAAVDLADLRAACGDDRPAALCREMTKLHEEVWRGDLGELADRAELAGPRGEITLVVGGAPPPGPAEVSDEQLAELVADRVAGGERGKDAAGAVAERLGLRRNAVFEAYLRHRPG